MKTPSIALCIPAYNAAAFLPRLLCSALSQNVPFAEIWVYDDCSTDDTAAISRSFGAKVIRGSTNQGCSYGKNVLAQATQCDWIHFHDADDALYPHFVETAQHWIEQEHPPDVVLFDYEICEDDTGEFITIRHFDRHALEQDAIAYSIREQINPFCGLYRRTALLNAGGYDLDPCILYNEDVAFHCRLAIAGLKFSADDTVTIINYQRRNSMSGANQVKCLRSQFHVMRKVAEALSGAYAIEIAQQLWGIAGVAAAYSDWQTVDACLDLAMRLNDRIPIQTNPIFQKLCQLHPWLALRCREYLIRWFKPRLRHRFAA